MKKLLWFFILCPLVLQSPIALTDNNWVERDDVEYYHLDLRDVSEWTMLNHYTGEDPYYSDSKKLELIFKYSLNNTFYKTYSIRHWEIRTPEWKYLVRVGIFDGDAIYDTIQVDDYLFAFNYTLAPKDSIWIYVWVKNTISQVEHVNLRGNDIEIPVQLTHKDEYFDVIVRIPNRSRYNIDFNDYEWKNRTSVDKNGDLLVYNVRCLGSETSFVVYGTKRPIGRLGIPMSVLIIIFGFIIVASILLFIKKYISYSIRKLEEEAEEEAEEEELFNSYKEL